MECAGDCPGTGWVGKSCQLGPTVRTRAVWVPAGEEGDGIVRTLIQGVASAAITAAATVFVAPSALAQVVSLVKNFGTTYSSGNFAFPALNLGGSDDSQ